MNAEDRVLSLNGMVTTALLCACGHEPRGGKQEDSCSFRGKTRQLFLWGMGEMGSGEKVFVNVEALLQLNHFLGF